MHLCQVPSPRRYPCPSPPEPLTPAQVYRFAVAFCQPRLAFRSVGKVTSEVLVTVLFAAAARISSISETCRRLRDAPCEETYANALYANLFCLEELKRKVNAAFVDHLPRPLRRPRKRPLRLGVDLTLLPYYGQHSLESREIYRSQANAGPTRSSPTPPPTWSSRASGSPWP